MALLVGVNVYAMDVSDFDIKGIKLGMSKSEVLKKMPCGKPKIEKIFLNTVNGKKVWMTTISCNNSEVLDVELNRHNVVYNIRRWKKFKSSPNWKVIERKIIKHYNLYRTDIIHNKPHSRNSLVFRIDWWDKNKRLMVEALDYEDATLTIMLDDKLIYKENSKWYEEEQDIYKNRNKESNIDF